MYMNICEKGVNSIFEDGVYVFEERENRRLKSERKIKTDMIISQSV